MMIGRCDMQHYERVYLSSTRHAIDPMAKLAASAVSMLLCTLSKSFLLLRLSNRKQNIKSKKLKVSFLGTTQAR